MQITGCPSYPNSQSQPTTQEMLVCRKKQMPEDGGREALGQRKMKFPDLEEMSNYIPCNL